MRGLFFAAAVFSSMGAEKAEILTRRKAGRSRRGWSELRAGLTNPRANREKEKLMVHALRISIASLLFASIVTGALAQTRGTTKKRPQAAPPSTAAPANPYGLSSCSDRPFARDCDRRGTW